MTIKLGHLFNEKECKDLMEFFPAGVAQAAQSGCICIARLGAFREPTPLVAERYLKVATRGQVGKTRLRGSPLRVHS